MEITLPKEFELVYYASTFPEGDQPVKVIYTYTEKEDSNDINRTNNNN